jgi:glycosyltransferase involved in cell wall biosynthesis
MLSILIPIYNYNAFPLVKEIALQCNACAINFEILCQDDCSNEFLTENQSNNNLENCNFLSNKTNLGRGKNINSLAEKATFDWLLILDCDTFPRDPNFIKNYISVIKKKESAVVFGGIVYEPTKPKKEKLLRWVYGTNREALSLEKRIKKPNSHALTSNLLLKKELFIQNPFDASITQYGYEDLCFLSQLELKNIQVSHIDNPTFHLNLETSILFLNKTKIALENLSFIFDSKTIPKIDSKIVAAYEVLNKLKLTRIVTFIFKKSENKIEANLLSESPSLYLFDWYKLGYFCKIRRN